MSALWIHLELFSLFISPGCRSFGEMVEICSQPHKSQQTGLKGEGRENPVLEGGKMTLKRIISIYLYDKQLNAVSGRLLTSSHIMFSY